MGLTLVKYLYNTEGKFVYFFEMFSVELWTSALKLLSRLLDVVIKSHQIKITHFL